MSNEGIPALNCFHKMGNCLYSYLCFEDPPKIIQHPNPPRRYLTQGYNTTFQCKASGNPPPKYKWLNPNGGEISSFGRFVIKDGNLIIKDIQPSDKGQYTCKAYSVIERTGENVGEVQTSADIIEVYGESSN